MKKTQVSSNIGVVSILSGFLSIFQNVKLIDFMEVFISLTYGEIFTMIMPFIVGIIAIFHNEETTSKKY